MLKTVFLLALAFVAAALTVQTLKTGVVKWRSGNVAATRAANPVRYWLIVALQSLACVYIAAQAF